jgi:hypothetical protein
LDLAADIQEAEIDIKEYLKEVEFHISSRTKAGLLDLLEELDDVGFWGRSLSQIEISYLFNNDYKP